MLCKHEVVGSIPSGSTKPIVAKAAASKLERAKMGRLSTKNIVRETSLRTLHPSQGARAGFLTS